MGGKNNFFNQIGTKIGVATGLMEDKTQRMDPGLSAMGQQVQQKVGQTALGQGPNISQMQYAQAMQDLAQQQAQAAASTRGVNPALAMRAAADATSQVQAQAAQQSAILGEEERRRAQEILLGQYGGQRNQQLAASQAGADRFSGMLSGIGGGMLGGGK